MSNREDSSMKICEYFNDIGLVDYDNVNLFLDIYSEIVKKNNLKNISDIFTTALFSFMKIISKDEKQLFNYANRTINAFYNNQLISKYKAIRTIKTVLFLKLKNLLTNFLFKLNRKNKQQIKKKNKTNYNSNNYLINNNPNKSRVKSTKLIKNNTEELNNNNRTSPLKISNNSLQNYYSVNNDLSECTFTPKINKNFKPYYEKKPVKSYTYYAPIYDIFAKVPKREVPNINYNNDNKQVYKTNAKTVFNSLNNSISNLSNIKSINNVNVNNLINSNGEYISPIPMVSPVYQLSNKKLNYNNPHIYNENLNNNNNLNKKQINNKNIINNRSNSNNIYDIELNNSDNFDIKDYNFITNEDKNNGNDNLFYLKMKRLYDIENNYSFNPQINKTNIKKNQFQDPPRYIQLHNDAKIRKENNERLRDKYLKEEMENFQISNKEKPQNSNYYKKLYNDALYYKEREIENEKRENEKYTFSPQIYKNNKYIVSMPFNQRRAKSIERKINLLKKKEDEEKRELDEMKKNSVSKNVNTNSKEVIDRLYSKEYEKIKDRIQKEKEEKELKNKKKQIINWDKVNYENNTKYSDSKKKDKNKIDSTNKINNIIDEEKEIKIDSNKNTIDEPFSSNSEEISNNNNNIYISEQFGSDPKYLMDKIKSEHSINFKSPKENNFNSRKNANISGNIFKNYIEIQSLSSDMNSIVNGNDSKDNDKNYKK